MTENVSHEQAVEAEARLLHDEYGCTIKEASRLIADSREAGGLDRLLRTKAQEAGAETIHRTKDGS